MKPTKRAQRAPTTAEESPAPPHHEMITPAVGPNVDGLTHQARLAHTRDEKARERLGAQLEARKPTPNGEEG